MLVSYLSFKPQIFAIVLVGLAVVAAERSISGSSRRFPKGDLYPVEFSLRNVASAFKLLQLYKNR